MPASTVTGWARAADHHAAYLEAMDGNDGARRASERNGFVPTGGCAAR